MKHTTKCIYLCTLSEWSLIDRLQIHTENERLIHQVARYGEFNIGVFYQKEGFSLKTRHSVGHKSISFVSMQVHIKTKSSWTIAVENHSVQKLNSLVISLLQIFDLFVLHQCGVKHFQHCRDDIINGIKFLGAKVGIF